MKTPLGPSRDKEQTGLKERAGAAGLGGRKREQRKRRDAIQSFNNSDPGGCVHFASIRWGDGVNEHR